MSEARRAGMNGGTNRYILLAIDSIGIDPSGHDRPGSVYSESEFLFPRGARGDPLPVRDAPVPGALVETDVTAGLERGAMECALTYASIFPGHLSFLGGSYVEDLVPHFSRAEVEDRLKYQNKPVQLPGKQQHGFAELFTIAEINQNIFVYAAREAGISLKTWCEVRAGAALTSSMTHELENGFELGFFGEETLPSRQPEEAGEIIAGLSRSHSLVFYKFQLADLISHTGQIELGRWVFSLVERFVRAVLQEIDPVETAVIVTSDHGHLEQMEFHRGHPKSKVPTWYFGPEPMAHADRLRTPEAIFRLLASVSVP